VKALLNWLGSFFVYRSPEPGQGYYNLLLQLTSKKLQVLAGTRTHYSKKKLVAMIIDKDKSLV
jgi:hypothetical protein